MNRIKIVLVIFLAALTWAGTGYGQQLDGTLKEIKTSATLTLGYRDSAPPFSFFGPDRDAAFRLAVNKALAQLYRSGAIAGIYERWFGSSGKRTQVIQAMYLLNGLPE